MYITTAFPYANHLLHMGHLSLILKADAIAALRSYMLEKQVSFYYSLHLTGLPVALRLDAYAKKVANLDSDGLSLLRHYEESKKDLTQLENWYELMRAYYHDLFDQLRIRSRLQEGICHTTTDIDLNYSKFVRSIFRALDNLSLLKKQLMPNPHCDQCDTILGDHERAKLEGVSIEKLHVSTVDSDVTCNSFCKEDLIVFEEISFCKHLLNRFTASAFGSKEIALNLNNQSLIINLETKTCVKTSLDSQNMFNELTFISRGVVCRCGGRPVIKYELRDCLAFNDENWKTRTKDLIASGELDMSTKEILLSAVNKMGPKPYSRTKGYGTKLPSNILVDSLADSAIHFLFYQCYEDKKDSFSEAHLIGKDLLTNHVAFAYYFLDPLLLKEISKELVHENLSLDISNAKPPHFKAYGHIKSEDNTKMSKSARNVITWEQLKQTFTDSHLRAYFYSRADSLEDEQFSKKTVEDSYRATVRNILRTFRSIANLTPNAQVLALEHLSVLKSYNIAKTCKLRAINEFVVNGFRIYLEKLEKTTNESPNSLLKQQYEKIVFALYPSYETFILNSSSE